MRRGINYIVIQVLFTLVFALVVQPGKLLGAPRAAPPWRVIIKGLGPTVCFPRQPAGQPLHK